jgi:hypothetical protein
MFIDIDKEWQLYEYEEQKATKLLLPIEEWILMVLTMNREMKNWKISPSAPKE